MTAQGSQALQPPDIAATDDVLLLELAHFASCTCDEEYRDTAPLLARLRDDETAVKDAWWFEIRAQRRYSVKKAAGLPPPPPLLRQGDPALLRRDGGTVRFGFCASPPPELAPAATAAAARGADELERFLRASKIGVERNVSAPSMLEFLFVRADFEANAWVWVENEGPSPVQHAPALDVLRGLVPLSGLSEAAPACIDDRLPPQMVAAAAHIVTAFEHVSLARRGALQEALLQAVTADKMSGDHAMDAGWADSALVPSLRLAGPGPRFAALLGLWFIHIFNRDLDTKGQLWRSVTADGTSFAPFVEWMLTRMVRQSDNVTAAAAFCGACVIVVLTPGWEAGAMAAARALFNAMRFLNASIPGDYASMATQSYGAVCSALHKLLCHVAPVETKSEQTPHSLASWRLTPALALMLVTPRWAPNTVRAPERGRDMTFWNSLLDAAQTFSQAATAGLLDESTASKAMRHVGRLFRAAAAAPALEGTSLHSQGAVIQENVLWKSAHAAALFVQLAKNSSRDERFGKWLIRYWLMPAAYTGAAKQRAMRCGIAPEPMRHCKCARCVPGRADCHCSVSDVFQLQLFTGIAARLAFEFPGSRALAARTMAYLTQNRPIPSNDVALAAARAAIILTVQKARVDASVWAGAVGERRRDAAIAAVSRARNRRTALAGLKLSPPIRDDCDEADLLLDLDATVAAARIDAGGWPTSDDEDENTALVPYLLDRALCALTGDCGADGRPAKDVTAAAAAAAEAAAAALLAEEEAGASVAQPSSTAGKKKRPGSSARKRAAATAATEPVSDAPAQASPDELSAACDVETQRPAVPTTPPAAPPASEPDAAIEELFPWLALGDAAPCEQDAAHEDDGLCIICLDAERSTPLPGCADAHAPVLCATCAAAMCARAAQQAVCPWCSAPCAAAAAVP